jgi:hypothetical protein
MRDELVHALAGWIPAKLATELADDFLAIRRDVAAGNPGRTAPGKLVESVAQALQFLDSGRYDDRPAVDRVLQAAEGLTGLDDGLRICVARIARSMYALRNKRGIAHKAEVDPNDFDLFYLHSAAQWVIAEMVRCASRCSVAEAHALLRRIRAPVGGIVEDFGARKLVLAELPVREEILVLLHAEYPHIVGQRHITDSLDRNSPKSVLSALKTAWKQRLVEGCPEEGYVLTRRGLREAAGILVGLAM